MAKKSKKSRNASKNEEQVRNEANRRKEGKPFTPRMQGRHSFGVMIKTATGEEHQLDVEAPIGEGLFEALQQAVEEAMQVPVARQRLFAEGGKVALANDAGLQAAMARLHGKARLGLRLVPMPHAPIFSACVQHPGQELKILCIPCGRLFCPKCLFGHVTRTGGHALADLEDSAQFAEAMKHILQQGDAQLMSSLKFRTKQATEFQARCLKAFAKASSRKRRYIKETFKSSVAGAHKEYRGTIRTTVDAAAYLHLLRDAVTVPSEESRASVDQGKEADEDAKEAEEVEEENVEGEGEDGEDEDEDGDGEEDEDPLNSIAEEEEEEGEGAEERLNLISPPEGEEDSSFPICDVHNRLRKTVFCMHCGNTMCLKCFALHVNKKTGQGHQCADMEDAEQFMEMTQQRFQFLSDYLEEKSTELAKSEAESLHKFQCALGQFWPAWEQYLDSLKKQFEAEAWQIQRREATIPTELLQWILTTGSAETGALQEALEAKIVSKEEDGLDDADDVAGDAKANGEQDGEGGLDEEVAEEGEEGDDGEELLLHCPNGRILNRVDGDGRDEPGWVCDGCGSEINPESQGILQCSCCRYDLCNQCEKEIRHYLSA